MQLQHGLRVVPQYQKRVWGGQRLKPSPEPYGEAWLVWEENTVSGGPLDGQTLAEVARRHGEALLGGRSMARTGTRFPVLIKLLDCADWLSLQVHPDDEQAQRLEGPEQFGKTEAWHILEVEQGAELLCGLRPGTTREALAQAIRQGSLVDLMQRLVVQRGDTVFVGAGTIHALGPGMLLYEVQQTSDITYRVFDWNRPQSAGRALHIDQSLAVADPTATGQAIHLPPLVDGDIVTLTRCPYFVLDTIAAEHTRVTLDTGGQSFHALTVIDGEAEVAGDGWSERMDRFASVLVPAACGPYQIRPHGKTRLLKASVE